MTSEVSDCPASRPSQHEPETGHVYSWQAMVAIPIGHEIFPMTGLRCLQWQPHIILSVSSLSHPFHGSQVATKREYSSSEGFATSFACVCFRDVAPDTRCGKLPRVRALDTTVHTYYSKCFVRRSFSCTSYTSIHCIQLSIHTMPIRRFHFDKLIPCPSFPRSYRPSTCTFSST